MTGEVSGSTAMIDLAYKGPVAVLKMHHGKASAMDAALCDWHHEAARAVANVGCPGGG